jgi:poly(A) polymerase
VRFAVRLGFAIEPATAAAIRRLAPLAADVSAERTRDELVKILVAGRGRALRLLHRTGLLDVVLPEIAAMRGVPQPPQFHPEGDVFVHTALVLDHLDLTGLADEDAEDVVLGALFHDVAKPPTKTVDPDGRIRFNGHDRLGEEMSLSIAERWRLPRRRIDRVADLVGTHMTFPNLPNMRRHKLREFLGAPDLPLHLVLHRADCGASHGDLSLAAFCEAQVAAFRRSRRAVVTGADLVAAGYPPGPRMGALLRWLRAEQLDGRVPTREEAVRRVLATYPPDSNEVPPT